jgi:hypothetical protein
MSDQVLTKNHEDAKYKIIIIRYMMLYIFHVVFVEYHIIW